MLNYTRLCKFVQVFAGLHMPIQDSIILCKSYNNYLYKYSANTQFLQICASLYRSMQVKTLKNLGGMLGRLNQFGVDRKKLIDIRPLKKEEK